MKKVFTIFAVLMLSSIGLFAFEKIQLEKCVPLQLNATSMLKVNKQTTQAPLAFRGTQMMLDKKSFGNRKSQIADAHRMHKGQASDAHRNASMTKRAKHAELTNVTIGTFSANGTSYPGEYYVVMTDAASTMQFIFDIDISDAPLELGKTYTLGQMYADYTGISDADDFYAWTVVTDATYTETKDAQGRIHVLASMTDENDNVYYLTYDQPEPQTYEIAAIDYSMVDYGEDMYIVLGDESGNMFYFDVLYTGAFEYGRTYTLNEMDPYYSTLKSSDGNYIDYMDASINVTKKEDGLVHIVASATTYDNATYKITFDEKPFSPSGVKINVNGTNLTGQYYSSYGMYVYIADWGKYKVQLAFDATEEKAKYTNEDIIPGYSLIYSDDDEIDIKMLASDIIITNTETTKILTGSVYAKNGDEYVLNLVYEKPDIKDIDVVVTNATLNNKTVAGFWVIGGKNADKTQDINLYFTSKAIQGTFTEKDMFADGTWLDDKSSGSTVTYQNLSAANLKSVVVGDSLVIEGSLALTTNDGAAANVTVHVSTPFAQSWGEWSDFAPFDKNTGKFTFNALESGTQSKIPVQVRKDNTGFKQFKFVGWGAEILTDDGVDLIVDMAPDYSCTVSEQNTGAYQSKYGEYLMVADINSYLGITYLPSTYDPETGVFDLTLVYYISQGEFGYGQDLMTMDKPITERDTVDIVSNEMEIMDYLDTNGYAQFVVQTGLTEFGLSAFCVAIRNTTTLEGVFTSNNGKLWNFNTYGVTLNGSYIDCQEGEFVVSSDESATTLSGWMIGTDEKYYRLNWSYSKPTGIESIHNSQSTIQNGIYNLQGMKVDDNYKGIVIKNGKKYLMK